MNHSCCPNYVLIVSSDSIVANHYPLADTNNTLLISSFVAQNLTIHNTLQVNDVFFPCLSIFGKTSLNISPISPSHTQIHTLYRRPNIRVTQKTRQEKKQIRLDSPLYLECNNLLRAPNRYTREAVCGPQNHETRHY